MRHTGANLKVGFMRFGSIKNVEVACSIVVSLSALSRQVGKTDALFLGFVLSIGLPA